MHVSVETLKGLGRKVVITIPATTIDKECDKRLRDQATKAKVDGFRPGKVPLSVLKQRYAASIQQEVATEMMQSTLYDALKAQDLIPAGTPNIEFGVLEAGKDFTYAAIFEVFPEIEIIELTPEDHLELVHAEVHEKDLNDVIDSIREQKKHWTSVTSPATKGDKIIIDFKGMMEGQAFTGGESINFELILGSGNMIPGFEDALLGVQAGETKVINVTFPESYSEAALAGKPADFTVVVHKVMHGELPEVNAQFIKEYGIESGDIEIFKHDIKLQCSRELKKRLSALNREKTFNLLAEKNKFDVPSALVDTEIKNMQHELYHQIFGHQHNDNEKIPEFPKQLFESRAIHRVHVGLLFSEYVKKHALTVIPERAQAYIEEMSSAYDDPQQMRDLYNSTKERMDEVEALVLEEQVFETMQKTAQVTTKVMSYMDIMNPKTGNAAEGEKL